jgi:hypothetical protein
VDAVPGIGTTTLRTRASPVPPALDDSSPPWAETVSCTCASRPRPRSVASRCSRTRSFAALPATCGSAAIVRICSNARAALNSPAGASASRAAGGRTAASAAAPARASSTVATSAAATRCRGWARALSATVGMGLI